MPSPATDAYCTHSRRTDPGDLASMLNGLPRDVEAICEVARAQTIHHNLRPHLGVPREKWAGMANVWPPGAPIPGMRDLLAALRARPPHVLSRERAPIDRLVGACMLESIFLTGLLRHRGIPARVRAGYFADTMGNAEHVIAFWEDVCRARGVAGDLRESDPDGWKRVMNGITQREQIDVDKHIEHWVCEYWDDAVRSCRLLDANDTFLHASSGLDVGFHLPKAHYEFAHEAWRRLRSQDGVDPGQHAEEPQDGPSHIRSQLLLDYGCLLCHEAAGFDDQQGPVMAFIKRKSFGELTEGELADLDRLAELLAIDLPLQELAAFRFEATPLPEGLFKEGPGGCAG